MKYNIKNIKIDEKEIQEHINFIEKEIKISERESRMLELRNWLDHLKAD